MADVETTDVFGARLRYSVFLAEPGVSEAAVEQMRRLAASHGSRIVVISDQLLELDEPVLTFDQFVGRLGGGIKTLLPLQTGFAEKLITLGRNSLPHGMVGEASDLYEIYVSAALQFVVGRRAVHYGSNRRFESVPDGLAITQNSYVLFDAKACAEGFNVDAAAIRQFSGYVRDFSARYETSHGRPGSFVCISTQFANSTSSLETRSKELVAACQTPLCCIDSATLADICELFATSLCVRQHTDWARLLVEPKLDFGLVKQLSERAQKDRL